MSKTLKGWAIAIAVVLLCITAAGCGGVSSEQPGETPSAQPTGGTGLVSISVNPNVLEVDNRAVQNLDVTATYADGRTANVTKKCTFETTDRTVAYVQTEDLPGEDIYHPAVPGGQVVALLPGGAIITITYSAGGVTKSIELPVTVRFMMP